MTCISPIKHALGSVDEAAAEGIGSHYAAEAAHVLLANSRTHAKRFAIAMHRRTARRLDTDMIEHWARVVTEIARLEGSSQWAAEHRP
jgi:hypothetical protein